MATNTTRPKKREKTSIRKVKSLWRLMDDDFVGSLRSKLLRCAKLEPSLLPFSKKVAAYGAVWYVTDIVGAYYLDKLGKLASLNANDRVTIRHIPNNRHDPFSMGVYVGSEQVGWLPAELTPTLLNFLHEEVGIDVFVDLQDYQFIGMVDGLMKHNGTRMSVSVAVSPQYSPLQY